MGTKAKCTKCGEEKWINTTKMKNLHKEFGIRPCVWLKKKYVCKKCARREQLITNSSIDAIRERIDSFARKCKEIYMGLYSVKIQGVDSKQRFTEKIKRLLSQEGVTKFRFVTYKSIIIGIETNLPIIGQYGILFV